MDVMANKDDKHAHIIVLEPPENYNCEPTSTRGIEGKTLVQVVGKIITKKDDKAVEGEKVGTVYLGEPNPCGDVVVKARYKAKADLKTKADAALKKDKTYHFEEYKNPRGDGPCSYKKESSQYCKVTPEKLLKDGQALLDAGLEKRRSEVKAAEDIKSSKQWQGEVATSRQIARHFYVEGKTSDEWDPKMDFNLELPEPPHHNSEWVNTELTIHRAVMDKMIKDGRDVSDDVNPLLVQQRAYRSSGEVQIKTAAKHSRIASTITGAQWRTTDELRSMIHALPDEDGNQFDQIQGLNRMESVLLNLVAHLETRLRLAAMCLSEFALFTEEQEEPLEALKEEIVALNVCLLDRHCEDVHKDQLLDKTIRDLIKERSKSRELNKEYMETKEQLKKQSEENLEKMTSLTKRVASVAKARGKAGSKHCKACEDWSKYADDMKEKAWESTKREEALADQVQAMNDQMEARNYILLFQSFELDLYRQEKVSRFLDALFTKIDEGACDDLKEMFVNLTEHPIWSLITEESGCFGGNHCKGGAHRSESVYKFHLSSDGPATRVRKLLGEINCTGVRKRTGHYVEGMNKEDLYELLTWLRSSTFIACVSEFVQHMKGQLELRIDSKVFVKTWLAKSRVLQFCAMWGITQSTKRRLDRIKAAETYLDQNHNIPSDNNEMMAMLWDVLETARSALEEEVLETDTEIAVRSVNIVNPELMDIFNNSRTTEYWQKEIDAYKASGRLSENRYKDREEPSRQSTSGTKNKAKKSKKKKHVL